jgi:hypothetical protein
MAMTFKTLSPRWSPTPCVDLGNHSTEYVRPFRVDTRHGDPITTHLSAGIPQAMPVSTNGTPTTYPQITVNGIPRGATVGRDVVLNCYASEPCTLTVEDSSNGTTWANSTSFELPAGVTMGVRFTPTLINYRVTATAPGGRSVRTVHVVSQLRDSNG